MQSKLNWFSVIFSLYLSLLFCIHSCLLEEEFEDTKGVIRIRKSKKNRQYNGQRKKDLTTILIHYFVFSW